MRYYVSMYISSSSYLSKNSVDSGNFKALVELNEFILSVRHVERGVDIEEGVLCFHLDRAPSVDG